MAKSKSKGAPKLGGPASAPGKVNKGLLSGAFGSSGGMSPGKAAGGMLGKMVTAKKKK